MNIQTLKRLIVIRRGICIANAVLSPGQTLEHVRREFGPGFRVSVDCYGVAIAEAR